MRGKGFVFLGSSGCGKTSVIEAVRDKTAATCFYYSPETESLRVSGNIRSRHAVENYNDMPYSALLQAAKYGYLLGRFSARLSAVHKSFALGWARCAF